MSVGCLLPTPCLLFLLTTVWMNVCRAVAIDTRASMDPKSQSAEERMFYDSSVIWPVDSPAPITASIANISSSNTLNLTGSLPQCNGRLYGRNIRLRSCMQVYHVMSQDRVPQTFGQRGTGHYDAPLPFRYLSHDGRCAIDLAHAAGTLGDSIAPVDLKVAARLLISICVGQAPSEGGILTGLGKNKSLAMRLMPYRPTVTCGPAGSGPPWVSCRDIIDRMPANNKRQVFGPKEDVRTTVPLPWQYTTTRQRCRITVDGVEPGRTTDNSDWYKIWVATNAVEFMCTQLGKNGTATALGDNKRLEVELRDLQNSNTPDQNLIATS